MLVASTLASNLVKFREALESVPLLSVVPLGLVRVALLARDPFDGAV